MGLNNSKVTNYDIESQQEISKDVDTFNGLKEITQLKLNLKESIHDFESQLVEFPKDTNDQLIWYKLGYRKAVTDFYDIIYNTKIT